METENSMDPAPDIPKRAALAAQHVNGQLPVQQQLPFRSSVRGLAVATCNFTKNSGWQAQRGQLFLGRSLYNYEFFKPNVVITINLCYD